jgi:hypothetical protein
MTAILSVVFRRLPWVALFVYGSLASAGATPLTLTGSFIQVGISDYGTFGSNGTAEPGILVDPTGKGNFSTGGIPNDLLTPGTPHDGFAINSTQTGLVINDNNFVSGFGTNSPTLLTGAAAKGFSNAATWTGSASGVQVSNSYFFNTTDNRIAIVTTITNNTTSNVTNLYFGRSEDPDPDVLRFGTFNTNNTQGDSKTAPNNLVSAAGASTGYTIGILNTSTTFTSNTEISSNCCNNNDPALVFNGTDPNSMPAVFPTTNNGDFGLQMAWLLGTLAPGASDTVTYDYVFGANQATVTGAVPELSTWAMMLLGFAGIWLVWRRRSREHLAAFALT